MILDEIVIDFMGIWNDLWDSLWQLDRIRGSVVLLKSRKEWWVIAKFMFFWQIVIPMKSAQSLRASEPQSLRVQLVFKEFPFLEHAWSIMIPTLW